MTRPRIELRIDELLLHGFAPADQGAIAAAAEAELLRLLIDHGLPAWAGAGSGPTQVDLGDRIEGGSISLSARDRSQSVGAEVGRAIYGTLAGHSLAGTLAAPAAAPSSGNRRIP